MATLHQASGDREIGPGNNPTHAVQGLRFSRERIPKTVVGRFPVMNCFIHVYALRAFVKLIFFIFLRKPRYMRLVLENLLFYSLLPGSESLREIISVV
jgi:hypothetical protein